MRSLIVGDIKQGFRWVVGREQNLMDDGESFQATISAIIRIDGDLTSPDMWNIFVRKSNDDGDFLWKTHVRGKESVTEEFHLSA